MAPPPEVPDDDASEDPEARPSSPAPLSDHAARNVRRIESLHIDEEQRVGRHQRAIETITAFVGRPRSFYAIAMAVVLWGLGNTLAPRLGLAPLDAPPFFWMQGVVALAALLVTMMVLITQNRQARLTELRSHLDLQMNILAEQKAAKLVALLEELRRDLTNVKDRHDPEAEAMSVPTDPRAVFQALDETLRAVEAATSEAADKAVGK